jgi:hypothetical protein
VRQDFSLARSRRKFKWSWWIGKTHRKRVQERLCITVLLFYWIWEYSYCSLERGRSWRDVLYRHFHLGVSFYKEVLFAGGGIVYLWMGYSVNLTPPPPKRTLDNLHTPMWYVLVPSRRRSPNVSTFKAQWFSGSYSLWWEAFYIERLRDFSFEKRKEDNRFSKGSVSQELWNLYILILI